MALARFFVVLTAVLPLLISPGAEAGEVGVNYGRVARYLPDPDSVVQLLLDNGITMVRIYDANDTILTSLANTGIKVMIMMPNDELAAAATDPSYALRWVQCNVSDYYPDTLINGVAVGNEVFEVSPELTRYLVPAMTNVQRALEELGLADAVKVTTPIHFSALKDTFPPSNARFKDDIAQSVMKPMLQFLQRTGSYLSVNPYPFFAYAEQPQNISLDYALGRSKTGVPDPNTRLLYYSLLDAMRDATYYAMENLTGHLNGLQAAGGGSRPEAKYGESGWASSGRLKPGGKKSQRDGRSRLNAAGDGFQPATVANAKAYTNYLINRVRSCNTGTPHRPDADMDVYIFALFNENMKGRWFADVEKHFGLFCPSDMKKVYEFDFVHGSSDGGGGGGGSGESWCVANAAVGDDRLQAALDWACSNGADCSDIQPGAACFQPNTKAAHATHAFNSYYQRQHRASGSCDFAGAASVFYQEPRIGNCVLPSRA